MAWRPRLRPQPHIRIGYRYMGRLTLHHTDLYRIDHPAEAWDLGLEDVIAARDDVLASSGPTGPAIFSLPMLSGSRWTTGLTPTRPARLFRTRTGPSRVDTASHSGTIRPVLHLCCGRWPPSSNTGRYRILAMLLAIDTSSRCGGMALADTDGTVVEARLWRTRVNHTAQLMPAVASVLQTHGLQVAHLTGVAVALGPGPFSALRVGVSAAKGLAMAAGLPIVGIDTLALEAGRHLKADGIAVAWLDAGRNEVAAAWFGGRREKDPGRCNRTTRVPVERGRNKHGAVHLLWRSGFWASGQHQVIRVRPWRRTRPCNRCPWTPADRLWELASVGVQRGRTRRTQRLVHLAAILPADAQHRRTQTTRSGSAGQTRCRATLAQRHSAAITPIELQEHAQSMKELSSPSNRTVSNGALLVR